MPRTLVADLLGAARAFATALLLLRQPGGTHATLGLFDSLAPLVAPLSHGLTQPGGRLGGGMPGYGIYETRAGRIAVAALEPHFRERLYGLLSLPMDSELANVMRSRTAAEWMAWGEAHDVPMAVCRND
jgi:alpha-methylacyl-CoA racemase